MKGMDRRVGRHAGLFILERIRSRVEGGKRTDRETADTVTGTGVSVEWRAVGGSVTATVHGSWETSVYRPRFVYEGAATAVSVSAGSKPRRAGGQELRHSFFGVGGPAFRRKRPGKVPAGIPLLVSAFPAANIAESRTRRRRRPQAYAESARPRRPSHSRSRRGNASCRSPSR
jgi:hypothetical protein